ncbi:MAG TPA: lipoate--protein ligase [Verrucomicrobia bacterium]|nr:lipoate--protein ligase [Verrucomicrobiota bacterium]
MESMSPGHALAIRLESLDPWRNLAVEEYFIGRADELGPVLLLWQAERAIVIGKNQNPWQECNLRALRQDGCQLARRSSGGGAVYHDRGNLNFSFITRRSDYDLSRSFGVVLSALARLGIPAVRTDRNSLFAGTGKISGNAFCFKRGAAMHHGTLLVDADLDRLRRYLTPVPSDIRSHAVSSVRDPVTNLRTFRKDLTVEELSLALCEAFRNDRGNRMAIVPDGKWPDDEIRSPYRKLISWDWIYGMTPAFTIEWKRPGEGRELALQLEVDQGFVSAVSCPGADGPLAEALGLALNGCVFSASALMQRLRQHPRAAAFAAFGAWADFLEGHAPS